MCEIDGSNQGPRKDLPKSSRFVPIKDNEQKSTDGNLILDEHDKDDSIDQKVMNDREQLDTIPEDGTLVDDRLINMMYNGLMVNFTSRHQVQEYLKGLPAEDLGNVLVDVQKEKVKCLELIRGIDQFLLMGKFMYKSFGQNTPKSMRQTFGQNIPKSMIFENFQAKADNGSASHVKKSQTIGVMPNSSLMNTQRASPELPYMSNPKQARFQPTTLEDLATENKVGQPRKAFL